jgi:asparagine synthase (glutamine-hydrolysing)
MTEVDYIPVCDPDGYYLRTKCHQQSEAASFQVTTDLIPDKDAIFSLLQFGAVVPPLSPWEGVARLLPGYRCEDDGHKQPLQFATCADIAHLTEPLTGLLAKKLDKILVRALEGDKLPVVLFSGGVDSGLIAARLAHLGYRNTLLLNYSFSPDDSESVMAEEMARKLGLRFERYGCERLGCESLRAPGKTYPIPFGDSSTVPTYALAKKATERLSGLPCVIFDGNGADDGGFGMTHKINQWLRLAKVPRPALKVASWAYERSGIWSQVNALENKLKLLRRLHDMPLLSAILAQNPLAGILYAKDGRERVDALLDEWAAGLAGDSLLRKVIVANMALTSANIYAQKAHPIYRKAGLHVVYPFMEHEMVDFSLTIALSQDSPEKKALLKALLAQQVPREMVYRPKSGFVDTGAQVFYDAEFQEMLWAATEEKSVLSGILFKEPLRKIIERLRRRDRLPHQLLNCIWAVAFTDRWYRTA